LAAVAEMTGGRPSNRPRNPCFSSGPCAKRPGWSAAGLRSALLGRSHRSAEGKARLVEVIERSRALLGLPDGWRLGILPASDTGAVEAALWSLLGPRGVDVLAWESFGLVWAKDVTDQLRIADARVLKAPYGLLPDLRQVDFERDVVLAWNGTTSGVRPPGGDWIAADRQGLVICDATSAVFAMELPWDRLDVVTWSWQKSLGGEGAHGMLALGPRAHERLLSHRPAWPVPKVLRLADNGKPNEGIFRGETLNTPSMLAVEDALDGLRWAKSIGGLDALTSRTRENAAAVFAWVEATPWVDFLAVDPATRSPTSICLAFAGADAGRDREGQAGLAKAIGALLDVEGVAHDVVAHRDAPPGLRLWAGPTVERNDLVALLPWLDWARDQAVGSGGRRG